MPIFEGVLGMLIGTQVPLQVLISLHQFKEAKSVAHWLDVAHFIGVNSRNRN